jgi:hypothetical protein
VGTSTRIPGPRAGAGPWRGARQRLRTWQRAPEAERAERADAVAAAQLEALAAHLRAEPEAFGLQATLRAAGVRLAVVLPRFVHDRYALLAGAAGAAPGTGTAGDELQAFVDRVAGDGALVVDTAVRRAATRAGAHADARLRDALDPGGVPPAAGESPVEAAFCAAYAYFFADAVRQFLATLMAEHDPPSPSPWPSSGAVTAADPLALVGDGITARGVALVPDPCVAGGGDLTPAVLGERAAALVDAAVRRVLGLAPDPDTERVA